MDKKSFNLLFSLVAASMVILGTYKMSKKKSRVQTTHPIAAEHKK